MNNIFIQLNYIKIYLQARNFSMFNYHIKSLSQFCMILDNKEVNTAISDLEEKVRFWTKDKTSEVKKSCVKNEYHKLFNTLLEIFQNSDESKLNL